MIAVLIYISKKSAPTIDQDLRLPYHPEITNNTKYVPVENNDNTGKDEESNTYKVRILDGMHKGH